MQHLIRVIPNLGAVTLRGAMNVV